MKRYLARWLQRSSLLRLGLRLMVWLFAPRNHVGAVGVIFNNAGQVLLVEHVFRPGYAWGLPGGWIERGENPAHALERELEEELSLKVQVKKLLLCEPQGGDGRSTAPRGLGLAFYCRPAQDDVSLGGLENARNAYEVLSARWVEPENINWTLLPLQEKAIRLGRREFEREQAKNEGKT